MLRPSRLIVVVVSALTLIATAGIAHAKAVLTYQKLAAMSAEDQAAILNPLRAVAAAAGAVGRESGEDVLAGIEIDAPTRTVNVYLTDLQQRDDFAKAMQDTDRSLDLSPARFRLASYSLAALKGAADSLIGRAKELAIESVTVPADASGLKVLAFDVARARQGLATARALASIPLTIERASAEVTNLTRRRDSPYWISGAALGRPSTPQNLVHDCTSGLPTRRNSDGRSYLITAAHCFSDGETISTGWEGGGRNVVGVVVGRANLYDAIAIDTASTGQTLSQEWDGPANGAVGQHIYDVSGVAWSYSGDMTCQDGYSIGIRCGLLVTSGYITWTDPVSGVGHAGVQAHQVDNGLAGLGGDSGGLVFALTGNTRQARGIVSARYGYQDLRWTEAPPILSTFGLSLAP